MTVYLILGIVGIAVITVALILGDVLEHALAGLTGDLVSTEVAGGFVSALGFGGAIALHAGAPDLAALAVGLGAGVVVGGLAAALTRLVRGGGTDSTPAVADAVGHDAVVVNDIPSGGLGTVRVRLGGHTLRFNARAELPLEAGSSVHVTGVLSPTAVTVAPR